MRLLITRPIEDAKRQAEQIKALGHEPLIFPLINIVFAELTPIQLSGVQAFIATSRNAVRGLSFNGSFLAAKALPIYCVGDGTGEFAREAGFERVITGPGRASDLIAVITHSANPDDGALVYLTGQHLAFDLESPLIEAGFLVPRVICYEAQELHPGQIAHIAGIIRKAQIDGIILMSPRTAAIFARIIKRFDLIREARSITCYCYSEAIAQSLEDIDGLTIAVASHPRERDLLGLIAPARFSSEALADLEQALGKR